MHNKIQDIKSVRALTHLLGKLGIKSCYRMFPSGAWGQPTMKKFYGWGLKESKDYIENKYEYVPFQPDSDITVRKLR